MARSKSPSRRKRDTGAVSPPAAKARVKERHLVEYCRLLKLEGRSLTTTFEQFLAEDTTSVGFEDADAAAEKRGEWLVFSQREASIADLVVDRDGPMQSDEFCQSLVRLSGSDKVSFVGAAPARALALPP
jgi:hypothetical protein